MFTNSDGATITLCANFALALALAACFRTFYFSQNAMFTQSQITSSDLTVFTAVNDKKTDKVSQSVRCHQISARRVCFMFRESECRLSRARTHINFASIFGRPTNIKYLRSQSHIISVPMYHRTYYSTFGACLISMKQCEKDARVNPK